VGKVGNIQHKLLCFLDWILTKDDDDKVGYWTNTALVLSFGIVSIIISIFTLLSTVFIASDGLSIMELMSRIILAGVFLPIGLGLIILLRRSFRHNEEEVFWGDLKDVPACFQKEESLSSSDILEIKRLIGTEVQKENT
jgi:hypothetical protein